MRRVVISAGHAQAVRGASGSPIPPYGDEYDQNVQVVNRVFELLPPAAAVGKFIDTHSTTQNQNLRAIVDYHNSFGDRRDLDVSIHMNAAAQTSALQGTEVLYVTQQELAGQISAAIAGVASWPNRGAKYRPELYFLGHTTKPAVLIEVCFVTSSGDVSRFNQRFEDICRTIAEQISDAASVEPEPEQAQVDITITGNVKVTINGQEVVISGEPDPIPDYQRNIFATVFYGTGANGAYGIPIPGAGSSALYLALPWKLPQARQRVRVYNRATGKSEVGEVWDLGPWCTSDNYVSTKTRPIAEQYRGKPLPALPQIPAHNVGKISNGAGIDLSPGMFHALGMTDNGPVDFEFLS